MFFELKHLLHHLSYLLKKTSLFIERMNDDNKDSTLVDGWPAQNLVSMDLLDEKREFSNASDDENEVVNIEFENDDSKISDEIDCPMAKVENYSSGTQSPSNSSEDGHTSFHVKKPGRKTDRQRVESGQRREWSDSEIVRLIQLWKENDILYNTNHSLYYVQTERKLAMDTISNNLQIPVKDVNDKMHSLRTYYCSQRQRLGNLMQYRGEAMKHFSRWKFYDQMSFLYESVTNRAFKSSLSVKSRRKRESSRSETQPYLNTRDELLKPRTSTRLYDPSYCPAYPDRSCVREPNEKESSSDIHPSQDESLDRRRLSSSNNNQYNEMHDLGNSNTSWEVGIERENNKLNSSDEMFGQMVASSLSQIEDEQEKELLKLNLQTMIYNVRFKKEVKQT